MKPRVIGACLALAGSIVVSASAQVPLGPTTPRFAEIAQLAQDGYADSARALIARVLASTPPANASYPEALYTAGAVARTSDSARNFFSQVIVEYASSAWADKALLRLAQLDYGLGRMDQALIETTRIFADFADSPVMPTAALWGARAAFAMQKMQIGCDWLTRGIAKVGDDLELRNMLAFAKQSCNLGPDVVYAPHNPDSLRAGPPPRSGDTARQGKVPPAPPAGITKSGTRPSADAPASPWRVQVAALRDKTVIQKLSQKIEKAGFKVYSVAVPGGLIRVQAGPFATRAAATAAVARIKAAVGGSPIVVGAP